MDQPQPGSPQGPLVSRHARRHRWFYLSLIFGAAAWILTQGEAAFVRFGVTADVFYLSYLFCIWITIVRVPMTSFRDWADDEDEGIFVIAIVTLAAVCFSMISIFALLNSQQRPGGWTLALSLASAPLGWLTLQTVASLHYAHVFYVPRAAGDTATAPGGGLSFPGTETPGPADFLYYSFVVGMTAQVSDVQVTSTAMRRLTIVHGIVSFAFNTVLIALAVNTVVALAQTAR